VDVLVVEAPVEKALKVGHGVERWARLMGADHVGCQDDGWADSFGVVAEGADDCEKVGFVGVRCWGRIVLVL